MEGLEQGYVRGLENVLTSDELDRIADTGDVFSMLKTRQAEYESQDDKPAPEEFMRRSLLHVLPSRFSPYSTLGAVGQCRSLRESGTHSETT